MRRRCPDCRHEMAWLPKADAEEWRCPECGREVDRPAGEPGWRAGQFAKALAGANAAEREAALGFLLREAGASLLMRLLWRYRSPSDTIPRWQHWLAWGVALWLIASVPPLSVLSTGYVVVPIVLSSLVLWADRVGARNDRIGVRLREPVATLGKPEHLALLLSAYRDGRLRGVARERLLRALAAMDDEHIAYLNNAPWSLSELTRLMKNHRKDWELAQAAMRVLARTQHQPAVRVMRKIARQHGDVEVTEAAEQLAERVRHFQETAHLLRPEEERAAEPEPAEEAHAERRIRMAHRCPQCNARMIWLPTAQREAWRCRGCGATAATDITVRTSQRAGALADALITRNAETRDAAIRLLSSEEGRGWLSEVLLELRHTIGPGLKPEGRPGIDTALRWTGLAAAATGIMASFLGPDDWSLRTLPFLMVIAGITLILLDRRADRDREVCRALRRSVIPKLDRPGDAAALLRALDDPRLRAAAEAQFTRLLPVLAKHPPSLRSGDLRAALLRFLSPHAQGRDPERWRRVQAAVELFGNTADTRALPQLRRLANAVSGVGKAPDYVRRAAAEAIKAIEARVAQEGGPASLLRPASPEDTVPDTLLRRPTGEVEEEGLLRRGEPPQ